MIAKRIFLSLWLLVSIPLMLVAQETKHEDQWYSIDQSKALTFKVDRTFAEREAINENLFRQEVYQLLGVRGPQFLQEMPLNMTYPHIGKTEPRILADASDTTAEKRIVNVSQVNTSNHPINIRNNLAPSIQITF